ncbi:MAG: bifunctional DNA primase/polymerase [Candidatus Nanohaloarchaea archaeon]
MKTRPGQFRAFIQKLMYGPYTPENYRPWLFPVRKNGKDPGVPKNTSWKHPSQRITAPQAFNRLKEVYGNVGIAGKPDDRLILVDIDDPSIEDQLKPTLKIRSRSLTGTHAFYWAEPGDNRLPMNIPTGKGEIRSSDQYVVAPGSHVPCTEEELTEKVKEEEITELQKQKVLNDPHKGFYTLDNDKEISKITFEELPQVFQDHVLEAEKERKKRKQEKEDYNPEPVESGDKHSALYDLSIPDLTGRGYGERDSHPAEI